MIKRILVSSIIFLCVFVNVGAQSMAKIFEPVADTLAVMLSQKMDICSTDLNISRVLRRGNNLDFYFTQSLGDFPWRTKDINWFRKELKSLYPESHSRYGLGAIYCVRTRLEEYATPLVGNNGNPVNYKYRRSEPKAGPFVTNLSQDVFSKGMSGRNIVLWQSHGYYYEEETQRWEWQRSPGHRTVEDLYTQSYVLPFLIPMLENAGAYVMTPRERDTQLREIIADNDASFDAERTGLMRRAGEYRERGEWGDAGTGFADAKAEYMYGENPFTMGSARQTETVSQSGKRGAASAQWLANIEEKGEYAVYVSYSSLQNSSSCAHYTVHHAGGSSEFVVNQTMGGGTWVYLGTFEFAPGADAYVELSNVTPKGHKFVRGTVVTADAVKFGGGVGKVARGPEEAPESFYSTSGQPAFNEGALYWMQWAGADTTLSEEWEGDYTKDFASKGAWVQMMSKDKGIPFDLSFGFHTDAGVTPNDSVVGTLAIYTLRDENSTTYPGGGSRWSGRLFADAVQTQIVNDLRADFDPEWTRRMIWDRSYSESRTTGVPAMLLELLSHQNFADMKYGLDPAFRFTVSRAVYKGMLKFLSTLYNVPYVVQPLPVKSLNTRLQGNSVILSWKAVEDEKEPTARPNGYMVYTRVDDGAFDKGIKVFNTSIRIDMEPGHLYSFKVEAFNEGGLSFPSEVVCAAVPEIDAYGAPVMIVNNFDRVSGPSWFDTPEVAGFDAAGDFGVAWGKDISYVGDVYEFRRDKEWLDDDNPGFGGSYINKAGFIVPGNTFDFSSVHAKALLEAGYAVHTVSRDAWAAEPGLSNGAFAVDLLCGKQLTTTVGRGAVEDKYQVFPRELQNAIRSYTSQGGNMIVSGAYIGTDVWSNVYPVAVDSAFRDSTITFVQDVLGYKWHSDHGSFSGEVEAVFSPEYPLFLTAEDLGGKPGFEFYNSLNEDVLWTENPDGIVPAGRSARSLLRYSSTGVSAAVGYKSATHSVVSFGFPLEAIKDPVSLSAVLAASLEYLR